MPTLFARGLLTEDEAASMVSAAAYRPLREVQDIAVRLADADPDLLQYHLLLTFGAARDETAVVELLAALRAIPTAVWNGLDVLAAVCAGYATTRRPDALAAFIHLAADTDRALRDALTAAGAAHGSPDDVAELVRILALGPDPGLVGIVLERTAREESEEWVEQVLAELERWDAYGEAAYVRYRREGRPPHEALGAARPLAWTANWLARHQGPVPRGSDGC